MYLVVVHTRKDAQDAQHQDKLLSRAEAEVSEEEAKEEEEGAHLGGVGEKKVRCGSRVIGIVPVLLESVPIPFRSSFLHHLAICAYGHPDRVYLCVLAFYLDCPFFLSMTCLCTADE